MKLNCRDYQLFLTKKVSLINLVTELDKIVNYKDKYNYILNNYLENELSKEDIINYLDNISNEEYYNLAKEVPGLELQNNDLITVENVKDLVVMNFTKRELFYIKWPVLRKHKLHLENLI